MTTHESGAQTKRGSVAVMRARVTRADGTKEVFYSHEKVPVYKLRKWFKLKMHLAFMRAEDQSWL